MEGSDQINSVEEIVSSDSIKEKKALGESYITDSSTVDSKLKTTFPENEAMDTDAPYENEKLVSESNSESNILTIPEENNVNTVNTCNMQDASNEININNESSRKESLAICESVFKAEGTLEMIPDEQHENKLRGIENEQYQTESCSNITVQNVNKEEIVGIKENNSNIIVDNSCNIIEENKTEAMITDTTLENSEVVSEQKENSSNTMINIVEGNRDSVIANAMKKYLDTAHQNSNLAYQKDVSGLKLLCDYGSDSDDDNEEESEVDLMNTSDKIAISNGTAVNPCPAISQEYRKPEVLVISESEEETDSSDEEDDSSSSSSTATSSSSSDESDDSSENECVVVEEKKHTDEVPKTKGELGLDDLPPIEDLCISVPESECVEIGHVLNIVDSLVVVQSIKDCPALDLDSVLFLDNGHKALGEVFDVFGKVGEACYCVRFNSKDHAISKGIEIGMPVFYAPRSEHSKFVFLADLLKMKGSDASWEHNNEPPPKFLDFSDDEEERKVRKANKLVTRDVEPDDTQPQNKFYRREAKHNSFGYAQSTERDNSRSSWSTPPFSRYPRPSRSPSPHAGSQSRIRSPSFRTTNPQPLIRPPSFRTTGPPPLIRPPSFKTTSPRPLIHPPSFRTTGPRPLTRPPSFRSTGPQPLIPPTSFRPSDPQPLSQPPSFRTTSPQPFSHPPSFRTTSPQPFSQPSSFRTTGPQPFSHPPSFRTTSPQSLSHPPSFRTTGPQPLNPSPSFRTTGPQPLIPPPSFRTTSPPQSHYHNAAAGAPAMPPNPSPYSVPPPPIRKDFNYNMANIPPAQSHFEQNQMGIGGFNMNVGGFTKPPPPPPPSPASQNSMMSPFSGSEPFITTPRNLSTPETLNSFTSNPPYNANLFGQGADAQQSFHSQSPVFMNRNVPPPRPPQGW